MKRLSERPSTKNLLAITLAGLSFTIAFQYLFGLIHRAIAPFTIVDLEFAWTPAGLAAMTAAWGAAGDAAARTSLWVDYLFMPTYTALAAGLVLLTARASAGAWRAAGLWLTLAPFGAWAWRPASRPRSATRWRTPCCSSACRRPRRPRWR